ncbi:MAG: hypothetical protein JNN01_06675 [Opitutaceae bacterium]|nr:hypothetical protein [Opitutaceae bacterium]
MISSHTQFIDAIRARERIRLSFYSLPDTGTVDHECAPLDYGPEPGEGAPVNQYWVWDYNATPGKHFIGLNPDQIVSCRVLGMGFDPLIMDLGDRAWSVPRSWSSAPPVTPVTTLIATATPAAVAVNKPA